MFMQTLKKLTNLRDLPQGHPPDKGRALLASSGNCEPMLHYVCILSMPRKLWRGHRPEATYLYHSGIKHIPSDVVRPGNKVLICLVLRKVPGSPWWET